MKLEYLQASDKDIYTHLISEFNACKLTDEQWNCFFEEYHSSDTRVIYLAKVFDKSLDTDIVVGTANLIIEMKAHRGLRNCIHVEDVVILQKYRRFGLGKQMMELLIEECKTYNPYKIILDCSEENKSFYEKCGFYQNEIQMRLDC